MKLKQSVNLLLIALFICVFQGTTIHFNHQVLDKVSECNLCDTSEQVDLYHHSSTVLINENLAIKTRNREEKIVVKSKLDYSDITQFKWADIVEYQGYTVEPIPLGYLSTAPPKIS